MPVTSLRMLIKSADRAERYANKATKALSERKYKRARKNFTEAHRANYFAHEHRPGYNYDAGVRLGLSSRAVDEMDRTFSAASVPAKYKHNVLPGGWNSWERNQIDWDDTGRWSD